MVKGRPQAEETSGGGHVLIMLRDSCRLSISQITENLQQGHVPMKAETKQAHLLLGLFKQVLANSMKKTQVPLLGRGRPKMKNRRLPRREGRTMYKLPHQQGGCGHPGQGTSSTMAALARRQPPASTSNLAPASPGPGCSPPGHQRDPVSPGSGQGLLAASCHLLPGRALGPDTAPQARGPAAPWCPQCLMCKQHDLAPAISTFPPAYSPPRH